MSPREADDCTLEELEAWERAHTRLKAEDRLAMLAIVHAAAAACVSKEGKEVAEKLQAKLNSMLDA